AAACAAALGWRFGRGNAGAVAGWARAATRAAAPFTLAVTALVCAQGLFYVMPLGRGDPFLRELSTGMTPVAARIDALRVQVGAKTVLAPDYSTTVLMCTTSRLGLACTRSPSVCAGRTNRPCRPTLSMAR
ncbi:MAG: hypothetical protein EBZ50_12675, partial [Alphaproteobacteria bacterium]|nr:hypothetical protein [Alphaproteobacteria bacterium]